MIIANEQDLLLYLKDDVVAKKLKEINVSGDDELTCQQWLINSEAKRMIFKELYWDIINSTGLKILDIGGGLTSFTRQFARNHDYTLVDLLAHDDEIKAKSFANEAKKDFIHICDWYDVKDLGKFDIIIANDLFPNVDQRLAIFLDRFLPKAKEIRLSLTYYNEPRFYKTKRLDADEFFCMLAWNGEVLANILQNYKKHIIKANIDLLREENISLYPNNRQVCIVKMKAKNDR